MAADGRFLGRLTVRETDGEEGRREVQDADCASLAAGLAFVAAVVVDPDVARAGSRSAGGPPSTTRPRESPAAPGRASPESSQRTPHRRAARLSGGAAIAGIDGLGPGIEIDPRAFVDLELPGPLERFAVRASLGRAFTSSVSTAAGTARITLTDVRFEPCFDAAPPGTLRLRGCGIVDAAILTGEGTRTMDARTASRQSIELGLGIRPTWILGDRLTLGLLLGAAVPMARYRFYFAPDATAYELAPWSGFAEFSAGVYFW